MTDKQIIKTFSDGYCLVLHENGVSLRENNYTKLQIVVGAKTNELFEFVKELYLDNKAKEQECERWKSNFNGKVSAIEELLKQLDQLKTENEKLKEQINCRCFDPKNNNNRCISYNRIAEDYERDLKQLNQLKEDNEELKNAYTRLNSLYNDNCNFTDKLEKSLIEIKEIVKPHQRNIDKICGHCRRYDCCHACCIDDINCYQYKKPTTPACDKYCELKEFEINNITNQILQKINEVV